MAYLGQRFPDAITRRIVVLMSAKQEKELERRARLAGMSRSQYVRSALFGADDASTVESKQAMVSAGAREEAE